MNAHAARVFVLLAVFGSLLFAAIPAGSGAAPTGTTPAAPSAAQLLADAAAAVRLSTSVEVRGSVSGVGGSITLDLKLDGAFGGEGTLSDDGYTWEVIRVGDETFVKGGGVFWRHFAGPAAVRLFAGRWVAAPAFSGLFVQFGDLVTMEGLIPSVFTASTVTVGPSTTVGGTKAVELLDPTADETLDVAADATGTPLKLVFDGHGGWRYEAWDAQFPIMPPASSVALSTLPAPSPYEIPSEGVSLVLPAGWTSAPVPAPDASFVKFLATAPKTLGFRTNLNLIVLPLPAGETLRQAFFAGASSAYQYVGTTRTVTIGGVSALEYRSVRAVKAGSVPLLTRAWGFKQNGQFFLFTFTATADSAGEYDPIFAAAGATIRLSSSAGTSQA